MASPLIPMAQNPIQVASEAGAVASASSLHIPGAQTPTVNDPPLQDRPTRARALQVVKGKSSGRGELHNLLMVGEPSAEESLRAAQANLRGTKTCRFFKGLGFQRQVVSVATLSSSFQLKPTSDETPLLEHPVVGYHHAVFSERLTKAFRKPEILGSLTLTDILAENQVLLVEWKVDCARVALARTALNLAIALVGGLDDDGVIQM